MALRAGRRPICIARYGGEVATPASLRVVPTEAVVPSAVLRHDFPAEGEERFGGRSDGYCFTVLFAAGRVAQSYDMLREFLGEQGYAGVPVPADVEELRAFRIPARLRQQLSLFTADGYVHNPLRILFPPKGGRRGALELRLYNESVSGHLLRFHDRSYRK